MERTSVQNVDTSRLGHNPVSPADRDVILSMTVSPDNSEAQPSVRATNPISKAHYRPVDHYFQQVADLALGNLALSCSKPSADLIGHDIMGAFGKLVPTVTGSGIRRLDWLKETEEIKVTFNTDELLPSKLSLSEAREKVEQIRNAQLSP